MASTRLPGTLYLPPPGGTLISIPDGNTDLRCRTVGQATRSSWGSRDLTVTRTNTTSLGLLPRTTRCREVFCGRNGAISHPNRSKPVESHPPARLWPWQGNRNVRLEMGRRRLCLALTVQGGMAVASLFRTPPSLSLCSVKEETERSAAEWAKFIWESEYTCSTKRKRNAFSVNVPVHVISVPWYFYLEEIDWITLWPLICDIWPINHPIFLHQPKSDRSNVTCVQYN